MSQVIIRKKSQELYRLFAICPGNLDEVLEREITALPAKVLQRYPGGVEFEGNLETAYLANLKLRTASRVLLLLKEYKKIFKPEELYDAVDEIDWNRVFSPNCTFAIYVTDSQTKERRIKVNPQFWALKAKDAIVDQFRKRFDQRPDVSREDPDITIRLHLHDQILKVYLDLSGAGLHERGYRSRTLEAPLKETLAAGLLLLSGWDQKCKEKIPFFDPFCGSGTLLIEAGLIATNTAPGLFRQKFGFYSWKDHQPSLFERIHARLKEERSFSHESLPFILGTDQSSEAISITKENLRRAGLEEVVKLKVGKFEESQAFNEKGLIVTNPPYGVRLDEIENLKTLYQAMGSTFKHNYKGWTAGVITSEKTLVHAIALKPSKKWTLFNGGLESQFSLFSLY